MVRYLTALIESLSSKAIPAEWRVRAGHTLATLGDPRPGVGLREDGLPDLRWVKIPGKATVRKSNNFKGLKLVNNLTRLEIADFELAAYPLTVAQFQPFVARGSYKEDCYWSKTGRQWRNRENRTSFILWDNLTRPANLPVTRVSWYEAEAYCNWLNEQWSLPTGTIRLPTEAEWEWTARGPEGRKYPWGKQWENWRCNSEQSGIGRASAVGCFPGGTANWWLAIQPHSEEVDDLAGNVWEWTASEYSEDYSTAHRSVLNTDLEEDHPVVLRGGSWSEEPEWLRGAARFESSPRSWGNDAGVRLARTLP